MKTLITTAVVGLAALGYATTASALSLTPVGTAFVATGSATLIQDKTLVCTFTLGGATAADGSTATITSVSFSGGKCGSITTAGLPWVVSLDAVRRITIHGVQLQSIHLGRGLCGPSNVRANLTKSGDIVISSSGLSGLCTISSTVSTSPVITGVK